MPLASFDLFASVIAACTGNGCRFATLTVDAAGAGFSLSAHTLTFLNPQRLIARHVQSAFTAKFVI